MSAKYFAAGFMFALLCVYLYVTRPQTTGDDTNVKIVDFRADVPA